MYKSKKTRYINILEGQIGKIITTIFHLITFLANEWQSKARSIVPFLINNLVSFDNIRLRNLNKFVWKCRYINHGKYLFGAGNTFAWQRNNLVKRPHNRGKFKGNYFEIKSSVVCSTVKLDM